MVYIPNGLVNIGGDGFVMEGWVYERRYNDRRMRA